VGVADLEQLKRLVLGGKCVAFLGAGLSEPPGLRWLPTVKVIADACGVPFEFEGKSAKEIRELHERCPDITDECHAKDPTTYARTLRELWPHHVGATRPAVGYVLRLPFKAILTTNFDPWIYLQARQEEYPQNQKYPALALHLGLEGGIFYVHGCFDADDIYAEADQLVFGRKSFTEAYGEASLLPGFLLNVFTFRNVLFIGFTPTEPHIANILDQSVRLRRNLRHLYKDGLPRRFTLLAEPNNPTEEARAEHDENMERLRALEIEAIPYPPRGKDYRGLEELLASWVAEGNLGKRPPAFLEGF
jgi:hypothetical protein